MADRPDDGGSRSPRRHTPDASPSSGAAQREPRSSAVEVALADMLSDLDDDARRGLVRVVARIAEELVRAALRLDTWAQSDEARLLRRDLDAIVAQLARDAVEHRLAIPADTRAHLSEPVSPVVRGFGDLIDFFPKPHRRGAERVG